VRFHLFQPLSGTKLSKKHPYRVSKHFCVSSKPSPVPIYSKSPHFKPSLPNPRSPLPTFYTPPHLTLFWLSVQPYLLSSTILQHPCLLRAFFVLVPSLLSSPPPLPRLNLFITTFLRALIVPPQQFYPSP